MMKPHHTHSQKDNKESEHWLFKGIALIKNEEEAKKFFTDLCTPTELQAMSDRWKVVRLLKKGNPYRQINEETNISLTTIGRVARYLTLGKGGYEVIYERANKNDVKIKSKSKNRRRRSLEMPYFRMN